MLLIFLLLISLALMQAPVARADESWAGESWQVYIDPAIAGEPAIRAAIEDLQESGKRLGVEFREISAPPKSLDSVIVVGLPEGNPILSQLVGSETTHLGPLTSDQAYRIHTVGPDPNNQQGRTVMVLTGQSVPAYVNGLYWLWDRLRVFKRIPEINTVREPVGSVRLTEARNEEELRNALRFSATWVSGGNILDLVPWDVEPVASRNSENRRRLAPLIDLAHAFHLKYLAAGDEISYHPSMLNAMNARPDPADPQIWQLLQEKYRRLFRALPGLDGVRIRTGELTRVHGPYQSLDVMHEPEGSDWTLERRYQTFLQKMHDVVVGQFGKIYFHRTWATTANEQHSDPGIYKAIFTNQIPTENLFLSPYMSLADRWYYQPFNPTFNLTPHQMVALFSTLDYHTHAGVNIFPSFPGQYHQGGLQMILSAEAPNLAGAQFWIGDPEQWSTRAVTSYTIYRLMWNPNEDLRTIAEDFAAIHVGREAAAEMAEILILSHSAYKDGIYIKPVAEKIRGNTLPHLRLTSFKRKGVPEVDRGRGHIDWLRRTMFEPSIGETERAMDLLDRGLAAAQKMQSRYQQVEALIKNRTLAKQIEESLELTHGLVETNNAYVKTCYAYFTYRDDPAKTNKTALKDSLEQLEAAIGRFRSVSGFCYDLAGVDQLVENACQALEDLEAAETMLAEAPDAGSLDNAIDRWTQCSARALEQEQGKAKRFFRWRARVDGRDIIHVRANRATIEHIEADSIVDVDQEFFAPLPEKSVTVFVKDLQSPESNPFLLEQPTAANNYTAKIYLFDRLPSYCWWEFELYYVDEDPFENGFAPPWQQH
jgi:hypothetical protein